MKKYLNFLEGEKDNILEQHKNRINEQLLNQKNTSFCPIISKNSKTIEDVNTIILVWGGEQIVNNLLNQTAKKFNSYGIPQRISCQLSLNKLRPNYKDKNTIIVDSLQKLVYVFDKNNNFVGKDVMISGFNKQSNDAKKIAQALLSWEEACKKEGFVWREKIGYVDVTGKGRKYDPNIIYDAVNKGGTRFLPSGIYQTGKKTNSDEHYFGGKNNVLYLFKGSNEDLNKEISIAIHGYYNEQPRKLALDQAQKLLSNTTDPNVSKEFLDAVSAGKFNLSQSYGCINISEKFLPILQKYMPNSYVFAISEDENNYLVDNSDLFFKKNQESSICPSPNEFGGKIQNNIA